MTFRVAGLVDSSERVPPTPDLLWRTIVGLYLCAIGVHYATMDFFVSAILGWVKFRLHLSASDRCSADTLRQFSLTQHRHFGKATDLLAYSNHIDLLAG